MEYHVILGFVVVILSLWVMGKITGAQKLMERREAAERAATAKRAKLAADRRMPTFVESTRHFDRPGQDWTKF